MKRMFFALAVIFLSVCMFGCHSTPKPKPAVIEGDMTSCLSTSKSFLAHVVSRNEKHDEYAINVTGPVAVQYNKSLTLGVQTCYVKLMLDTATNLYTDDTERGTIGVLHIMRHVED